MKLGEGPYGISSLSNDLWSIVKYVSKAQRIHSDTAGIPPREMK